DVILYTYVHQPLKAHTLQELNLRHDQPELHEMASRLRLFRAKRRTEAVDAAECRGGRLEIQLSRLRQIRLLAEVVGLEQRGGPFRRVRGEDRRVDENEVAVVEEIADGLFDLIADLQHGVLLRGAKPQVAEVHEKRRAVLLGRDRIVLGELNDLEGLD